ncbi:polymorphic toxin type 17 domain-containing protein [Amycolatopsis lurida]|uniref:polymorphic toxin type 17 domain-containing protein n=1 Tax=Amycolatopsis lurida TaxID=31959 RepID=UPI003664380D
MADGRKIAVQLRRTGGSWTIAAAEAALSGTDADVLAFVRTQRRIAAEQDDRARVAFLADSTDKAAKKTAAETALFGAYPAVQTFLRTQYYDGKVADDRVRVGQIMSTGGPATKEAAQQALNGTPADVEQFLATGQYVAAEHDDRIAVGRIISTGGPNIKAAGQVALAGPPSFLRIFLQVGQYKAQRMDHDAATHAAEVRRYVAEANRLAADARASAAEAARAAAVARNAANEAQTYADQANRAADEARRYADQAKESARQAQESADAAARSARQARDAANAAQKSARAAEQSAAEASASAARARIYSAEAQAAAADARASAIAAGKSANEAAQAAADALKIYSDKRAAEDKAQRENPVPVPPDPGGDADPVVPREMVLEGGMSLADLAGLLVDLASMFDPTPVSNIGSGLMSLFQGDWAGVVLSAAGAIPGLGAGADFAKAARRIEKGFGFLAPYISRKGFLENALHNVKGLSPDHANRAFSVMNTLHRDAEKYLSGKGPEYLKALKAARLPTMGPIRFVPADTFKPSTPRRSYNDAYGNEWRWNSNQNEWDVQIKNGDGKMDYFAKDKGHANISPEGRVTHK